MKLTIINGSPRYKKSNSDLLIQKFTEGFSSITDDTINIQYAARNRSSDDIKSAITDADCIIIVFPLYTDCMPGIVKEYFENMAQVKFENKKKIGFIVQSGFPESIHSTYVERYLEKYAKRYGFEYTGTVIKGGVEGIQIMPDSMTKKLFKNFYDLGEYYARNQSFNPEITFELRKPFKLTKSKILLIRIFSFFGLTNYYWNSNLKKNGAFDRRFDKPFIKE